MKIILSCYTDLGNPSTPKGLEPEWLGKEFNQRGELSTIICRGISKKRSLALDTNNVIFPIFFGNKIPLFLSAIEKFIYHKFPSRYYSHHLFDILAAKHIKNADVLCCEHPSLIRQIRAAKKNGMKVFTFATSAHILYTKRLMREEYKKYNLAYTSLEEGKFDADNITSYAESDLIFTRSEYTRKSLIESGVLPEKIYPKPINVFFNSEKYFPSSEKKEDIFRCIFVGQVSFAKGVHYLLDAWEKLDLKNAELLICGGIEPLFKETFNKYFNNESIRFLGHVDPLSYLQKSSVFCFPSLTEGCSQAILEAMACSLPVIATENSGSLAEHGKEGFIVPIRDSEAFVKYIKYFYDKPSKMKNMGQLAAEKAKNYTIQKYAKNTADFIKDAYESIK